MGKQAPRLVVVALIAAALIILAFQNSSPSLALVFLGFRTVTLPLGVWLSGAIALGVLTTIAIAALANLSILPHGRASRRQWTVRPDTPPPDVGKDRPHSTDNDRSWNVRSPETGFRRDNARHDEPREQSPPRTNYREASPSPSPNNAVAAEDWQAWGQRNSPNKWENWSDASGNDPTDENLSRRQRQDRQKAEATIHDLDKGWDDSAQETVYVAPGGSDIEDALDDIADGWEDWESEDNPLADTAYAERYEGVDRKGRRDSIYAPPDDEGDEYEDWENLSDDTETENSEAADSSVYDAEYRVIIPPYRPLDGDENEGDRTP